MAAIPDYSDLANWIGITGSQVAAAEDQLTECIDAAVDEILDRCLDGTVTALPAQVRTAMLMYGSRIYKRKTSPEGVAGFGDLGVVRISNMDVDVEALIGRYLRLDGFA